MSLYGYSFLSIYLSSSCHKLLTESHDGLLFVYIKLQGYILAM